MTRCWLVRFLTMHRLNMCSLVRWLPGVGGGSKSVISNIYYLVLGRRSFPAAIVTTCLLAPARDSILFDSQKVSLNVWTPTMISPGLPDNSPRLPFPALPSSGTLGLSASGRLQTHLSSFNSEQRLRNLPSVTEDLEKQYDLDPSDSDDGIDNNKQLMVKRRFVWLARAFIWFSALFFPISVLGNCGTLLRRPSVNRFSGDHESGPRNCQKVSVSTK